MKDNLIMLVRRIKEVETLEELAEVKALADSLMRKEKRLALLTLLAIAEEMGEAEVLDSIDTMSHYLGALLQQRREGANSADE